MQGVGGAQSAIVLYESCIVSSLLTNAGTWVDMKEESVNRLDNIQDTFNRALISLPLSAPRASLQATLGIQGMKWRDWEAKILLIQAIGGQEEGNLAREVLEEQLQMGGPGLAQEVTHICKRLSLPDASREDVSKEDIKKAVHFDSIKSLKLELKGRKLQQMANSDVSTSREYTSCSLLVQPGVGRSTISKEFLSKEKASEGRRPQC